MEQEDDSKKRKGAPNPPRNPGPNREGTKPGSLNNEIQPRKRVKMTHKQTYKATKENPDEREQIQTKPEIVLRIGQFNSFKSNVNAKADPPKKPQQELHHDEIKKPKFTSNQLGSKGIKILVGRKDAKSDNTKQGISPGGDKSNESENKAISSLEIKPKRAK